MYDGNPVDVVIELAEELGIELNHVALSLLNELRAYCDEVVGAVAMYDGAGLDRMDILQQDQQADKILTAIQGARKVERAFRREVERALCREVDVVAKYPASDSTAGDHVRWGRQQTSQDGVCVVGAVAGSIVGDVSAWAARVARNQIRSDAGIRQLDHSVQCTERPRRAAHRVCRLQRGRSGSPAMKRAARR